MPQQCGTFLSYLADQDSTYQPTQSFTDPGLSVRIEFPVRSLNQFIRTIPQNRFFLFHRQTDNPRPDDSFRRCPGILLAHFLPDHVLDSGFRNRERSRFAAPPPDLRLSIPDGKTEAAADAYIAEHMKRRAANKAFDAEQKAKQEANRKNASPDLPRFEIGRCYFDKHYCDDGYDSEYITEIEIKDRSACFVTYCEKNRRGDSEPKRAKIKFDDKGEYISDGWNWYRAAALMPTEEEQAAQREAQNAKQEKKKSSRTEPQPLNISRL